MITEQEAKSRDPEIRKKRAKNLIASLQRKSLLTVVVEPASKCNLACSFCDAHSGRAPDFYKHAGLMKDETYKKIIDDLYEHNKLTNGKIDMLQFFGNGEPLLNKKLEKFVELAVEKDIAQNYRVISNGVILTPERVKSLIDSGISEIHVSLDTTNRERYLAVKKRDHLDRVLKNLHEAIPIIESRKKTTLFIKYFKKTTKNKYDIKNSDSDGVAEMFMDKAKNSEFVHLKSQFLGDIGFNMKNGKDINIPKPCEIPFYLIYILHRGNVSGCCSDVFDQLRIGNVLENSVNEILLGDKLKNIRMAHLNTNFDDYKLCKSCTLKTVVDIDDFKNKVQDYI